jgi:hypothetical protein
MLKLTRHENGDGSPVYISAKHISAIGNFVSGATCVWTGGYSHLVCETPEQILAMPEMLNELYPPMLVTKGAVPGSYEPGGMTFIR